MKAMIGTVLCLLLLLTTAAVGAPLVLSLVPTQGTPGTLIEIGGGPFTADTRVQLGPVDVLPERVQPQRVLLRLPQLPAGAYRLRLSSGGEEDTGSWLITLLPATPHIRDITPDSVDYCPAEGRPQLRISGDNFAPGARLLVGDATLPLAEVHAEALSVILPMLPAGRYPVQVINPDGLASLPATLAIRGTPEILSVSPQTRQVTAYDLILQGSNFHFDSLLQVNGRTVGRPQPRDFGQREFLRFVNCNTLVYHRTPATGQDQPLELQVINPDGGISPSYSLSAP